MAAPAPALMGQGRDMGPPLGPAPQIYRFEHERALQCRDWLESKVFELKVLEGLNTDLESEHFSSRLYIYERILGFDFEYFPDFCIPWHLLMWEHCRWDHVYFLIYIIEQLKQPTGSGAGEPIVLDPFQVMIIFACLGPENPETGLRVVREAILTLGRKNAKSSGIAALVTALMSLSPDDYGLKGQEIQIGASDKKQAGIVYSMIERYIQFDTTLGISKRFKLTPSRKELAHRSTLTELRCLSSDVHRQHGGNPAIVLLDEIGNVPNAQAQAFYSVLTTAFGAQIEPLTFLFSTQAPNDQHMFSQMVDRAMRINEGMIVDYSFVGFVFTVPEHDLDGKKISPYDESMWRMGNPGLGTILNATDIKNWAKKARDLPSLQNQFENLKLNRRVSETEALLSRSAWADNSSSYDLEDLWGAKCTLGLDLSETTDLAALVALFEPQEHIDWKMPVVCRFYLPGDGLLERAKRDKVPYDVWSREGYLNAESSGVIDYSLIAEDIKWFYENFEVSALGFDRWKIKYLIKALGDLEFPLQDEDLKKWMVEVGQGFRGHTRGIELLEGLVIKGRLAHDNNPVLTWNAANAVTIKDPSGNRKIEKTKSFGRVDGIIALMCAAYARGEMEIGYEGPSDYENEDFEM